METKIIECSNGFNWGKFLLARFDEQEWSLRSSISDSPQPLLRQLGWGPEHLWVLDLQTGEGAYFRLNPHGHVHNDLNRHRIWVCPLFEPFLQWLYDQGRPKLSELPAVVELPNAEGSLHGYRRPGVDAPP